MPGYLDKINKMKKAGQLDSTPDNTLSDSSRVASKSSVFRLLHGMPPYPRSESTKE